MDEEEKKQEPSTVISKENNQENDDNKGDDLDFDKIQDFPNTTINLTKKQKEEKKKTELRRIQVPAHRMSPLKKNWDKIVTTIVENMKLQIRMNTKKKSVEIKTSEFTEDKLALQRSTDFLKAFMLGFELNDAIALLRLDDLYLETFEIKDVKTLHGDHLSRCIGRISGEQGKTKNAIENSTRTRIILADQKISILGSFSNIQVARNAICSLILGSPPGKVYSQLRYISKRNSERS